MAARRGIVIASTAVTFALAATIVATTGAQTPGPSQHLARTVISPTPQVARERPRGAVEDCSRISAFGASLRDFTRPRNLVVGPLAVLRAGRTLDYAEGVGGNKLFVVVKAGHRVTLELSPGTRQGVGFVFGRYPGNGDVSLRDTRRIVTFIACKRASADGQQVSEWVGGLLARSPRCVPLNVWVDDERSPRRAVIRFGVRSCS